MRRKRTQNSRDDDATQGSAAPRVTIPTKERRLYGMATGDRQEQGNKEKENRVLEGPLSFTGAGQGATTRKGDSATRTAQDTGLQVNSELQTHGPLPRQKKGRKWKGENPN